MRLPASVIVTTHENPKALDLVLAALVQQTRRDFEVLVADDGSGESTRKVVAEWDGAVGRRLAHIWQPNRGFRVARARNRAVASASGDHLLFLDGDSVPHPAWVADLLAILRPRGGLSPDRFVQGHRVLCGSLLTSRLSRTLIENRKFFSLSYLLAEAACGEVKNIHNALRIGRSDGTRWKGPVEKGIRTANFAVGMTGFLAVNGFDESYEGWGREDADLAIRLARAGFARYEARFRAPVFHLHHPPAARDQLGANDLRLAATRASTRVRAVKGFTREVPEGPLPHPPLRSEPDTA